MSRAVHFTQAQVRRAIRSAESAGLRVTGVTIKPDGSITIESGEKTDRPVDNKEIVLWPMMMPRPRPPHLHRETTRHGNAVWYVRIGKGPRIRIKATYGSPEFEAAYQAAIAGEPISKPGNRAAPHTLQWLWDSYRQTGAWLQRSAATRRQRELIMAPILKESGAVPFAEITKRHIGAGLDRRSPGAGHNFLKTIRGLFRWAAEREHVKSDPTAGVAYPTLKKSRGFVPWTREDVAA